MSTATYNAHCWAEAHSPEEIREEIARCEKRYLKLYPWDGVENAQYTLDRIATLQKILLPVIEG